MSLEPSRWTPLVQLANSESTPWRTHTMIYWLLGLGYVERPRRGIYQITEKGRSLLEALNNPRFFSTRRRRTHSIKQRTLSNY